MQPSKKGFSTLNQTKSRGTVRLYSGFTAWLQAKSALRHLFFTFLKEPWQRVSALTALVGKDSAAARHGMHGIELLHAFAKDVPVAVPVLPRQAATGCGRGADGQRLPRVLGRAGIVPGARPGRLRQGASCTPSADVPSSWSPRGVRMNTLVSVCLPLQCARPESPGCPFAQIEMTSS